MSGMDEKQIQAAWKSQPVQTVSITPAQLRARATHFATQTNRRNRIDLVSFSLLFLISMSGAIAFKNMLVRAGVFLLALWSLVGIYSIQRFHKLVPEPAESMGATSVAWYRKQLERQRDVALSRPWGIALAVPGACLLLMGYVDTGVAMSVVAILGGVMIFSGIAIAIHGKILAGKWQHEIEVLQAAEREWEIQS